MRDETRAFLSTIAAAPLFSKAGDPTPVGGDVIQLASWEEVTRRERRAAWEEAQLEARAELTTFLSKNHPERYRAWNELTREIKPQVQAVVEPASAAFVAQKGLSSSPAATARWDLLAAAMEHEFSDLKPLGFYDGLARLYVAGRYPCGYQGQYPKGRLEIY